MLWLESSNFRSRAFIRLSLGLMFYLMYVTSACVYNNIHKFTLVLIYSPIDGGKIKFHKIGPWQIFSAPKISPSGISS